MTLINCWVYSDTQPIEKNHWEFSFISNCALSQLNLDCPNTIRFIDNIENAWTLAAVNSNRFSCTYHDSHKIRICARTTRFNYKIQLTKGKPFILPNIELNNIIPSPYYQITITNDFGWTLQNQSNIKITQTCSARNNPSTLWSIFIFATGL